MLEQLTLDQFVPHVASPFWIEGEGGASVSLRLVEAGDLGSTERQEQFHLIFCGPEAPALRQGTYRLNHSALGSLSLFLVPIARTPEGFQYQAVFNRIRQG
jgi:hypothetical protein